MKNTLKNSYNDTRNRPTANTRTFAQFLPQQEFC